MNTLIGASTEASDRSYRVAFGPNAGRKALTLQTIPATTTPSTLGESVSKQAGFSLHAGTACKPNQTKKLERQTWAQRLKRVFAIEIEKCEKCGGKLHAARMKVIACIEEPEVIDRIVKQHGSSR